MKMNKQLREFLDEKNVFKLICGAGNKNISEITKLTALYAAAGCRFFDLNASIDAVRAAKKGIELVNKKNDCFICVSVGTKDDPHLTKCRIDLKKCISCSSCKDVCIQKAINKEHIIDENKCIGCGKCMEKCTAGAIIRYSKEVSLENILPDLIKEGIDCVEYHAISDNDEEVMQDWAIIVKIFNGVTSVCLDRSKLGNERLIERLRAMKNLCVNTFMVQADGAPMSGGKDDFRTTLQAVATADIVEKAQITPYILMSGGTNSKTMELARKCDINVCGFAVGSFARKIVREYIENENFLTDKELFNKALKVAKELVGKVC